MMSTLLLLSVLCCCLVSWVGAFPSHGGLAKRPMPATVRRFRDIPVRTKSVPCLSSGDDVPSVVSAFSGLMSAAIAAFPEAKQALEKLLVNLPNAKATFPLLKNYVPQSLYVGMIQEVYNSSFPFGHDSYTVVAGPKGGGKTTGVQQMLNGKSGVLFVDVSEADTEKTILDKLLDTTREPVKGVKPGLGILSPFFLAAAETADGRRITVVLEVERGTTSDGVLYMVKASAKKLACFANVIIILSEANAALMFGDDKRQSFLWVDGMTNDEATEYAKKLFPAAPDRDLNLFFDKVGTLPLDIRLFAEALGKKVPADDLIEAALCEAEDDLYSFAHPQILEALKKSPDGVRRKHFRGVENKGVNLAHPKQVGVAMRETNAIVFHKPSGEYRLASRAHRTALLERYDPVE